MASIATACRLSVRLTSKQVRQDAACRGTGIVSVFWYAVLTVDLNRVQKLCKVTGRAKLYDAGAEPYDDGRQYRELEG